MKKQYILISILSLLLMIPMFSAAVAMNLPTANTNHSGTITFNCTKVGTDSPANATALWIKYNASGGATSVVLTTITNTSANWLGAQSSVSVASLSDAATYNFSCYFYNTTANSTQPSKAGITVDNTDPVVVEDVGSNPIEPMDPLVLTCSCADALDTLASLSRTIIKPSTATVTVSSSPYTARGSDVNVMGRYTWNCSCIDNAGNIVEKTEKFRVETDEDATQTASDITNQITSQGSGSRSAVFVLILLFILMVGIIIIIVAFYSNVGKKKK